ncbi:hypothetical protein TCDM_09627 [Trypanosoma cruzi Dm28c]|uniref:Uncharacterized protein n=1 Tax=Trypanosoma cruzi Dm28c TaxID=1416333 RepID=V5B521_TRYCR|nr:hypothetical protein TCDM_09627 [Trypanosoma cruzi Dm28c]
MKEKRSSSSHRSSHSHSCYYCCSLSSVPHRHATLTSTRAPPARQSVMRPRCAATSATSPQSNSSASSTSLTIAGMPRPHNTHSATLSCRLSSTIMNATPNAYWRTCSMRWNHTVDQVCRHALQLVVLLLLGAHPHILSIHGLGAARGCRQEQCVWKKQMCGNNGHPHSLRHLHSLHPPTQKGGVMGKRSPPHSTCTRAQKAATPSTSHCNKEPCAHTHTRPQREGSGASKSTALFFTSLFSNGLALHPTLTVRHGAHQPLPSVCTQQAGAQSPSCRRNGEHKH